MRLLLDMGLSPRTAQHLRSAGHDAVHLTEQNLQQLADEDIVRKAEFEQRAIVTFDLDFSRISALQRLARPSIVLFRLERFTTDEINTRLSTILERFSEELEQGAIVVVDTDRVRIRRLPMW